MKFNIFKGSGFTHHLLPITVVFVIISIYFAPMFAGKVLVQSDNIQLTGTFSEIVAYREKGEDIQWNNKEFSGLPITGRSKFDLFWHLNQILYYGFIPKPVMIAFSLFLGFYLFAQFFGVSRWLAAIGAFAFAFSTFNIISLEAGHDNKVLAMAFMAPVLWGIYLAYNGQLVKGGIATMFGAGFQLFFGHVQITYYLLIMVLAYLIVVIVNTAKNKTWKQFITASSVLAGATLIAVGCNFSKLYALYEYSSYSTRGGSELTSQKSEGGGLSKDYALAWSNGAMETFTILFPYFQGGASSEKLSESSETYKELTSKGVDRSTIKQVTNQVPLYWGTQPFTAGPIYFGIIIVYFFIIGLFIVKHQIKWWALGLTILSLLLAMGKNLEWFTDIFFYYVPLYNKFRSVTMILSIAQLVVPLLAILALYKIIREPDNKTVLRKRIVQVGGALVGIGIFFLMFKNAFFDFSNASDDRYGFPDWLVNAIVEDRMAKFNSSILMGCFLVLITAGGLWLFLRDILKTNYLIAGLAFLIFIDLWSVNKRYLGQDDFQSSRRNSNQSLQPSRANLQIQQDTTYYRVFNLVGNPFSDGITSYHHYSIGGYSAIKMQRYQELIDRYLSKGHQGVLNMLNAKYYIVEDADKQPSAQRNPGAMDNAWLVKNIITVKNADEEIEKLENLDIQNEALIDQKFDNYLSRKPVTYSGEGSIELQHYHPERMVYKFNSTAEQFIVFSDIYYAPGWKAYVDDNPVEHVRVNYVLRGMYVPAGNHTIVFKYEPGSHVIAEKVVAASWIVALLSMVFGIIYKKKL